MTALDIEIDISGQAYRALLEVLFANATHFGFVVRGPANAEQDELLEALADLLETDEMTDHWPGTTLFGGVARVLTYKTSQNGLAVWLSHTNSLFTSAIAGVEDFFVIQEGPILETISHERWGILRYSDARLEADIEKLQLAMS